MSRRRPIEVARGAWGLALLAEPDALLRVITGRDADSRARRVARILGARHLCQAVVSGRSPSPTMLRLGAWVDCAHAVSGVALAIADPPRARAALTDSAVAAAWAVAGSHDLHARKTASSDSDARRG